MFFPDSVSEELNRRKHSMHIKYHFVLSSHQGISDISGFSSCLQRAGKLPTSFVQQAESPSES